MTSHQNPDISPLYSIGRSDGRCVQRAGTYSSHVDDVILQGIPRSKQIIPIIYPSHVRCFKFSSTWRFRFITLSIIFIVNNVKLRICYILLLSTIFIVARVQPKMSKGITDLLLLNASCFFFPRLPYWTEFNFDNQRTFEMCPFKKWYRYLLSLTPMPYRHRTN